MGWQQRLRPGIILISPEGNKFTAKWRGDDITIQKRVNRTAHPDLDGESAQDLGLNSPDCPLTIYFDGLNHDTEALRFSRAIAERGVWDVTHPVYGFLRLQPVKVTIAARPVESGNVTEISGEWFAPVEDSAPPAPDNTAAVRSAVSGLSAAAMTDAAQIAQKVASGAAAAQSAARQFRKGLDAVKGALRSASARVTAIMGTINDLTLRPYLDIAAISGAVIQLAESPGLFLGSMASRLSMYARLGNRIIADLPGAANFSRDKIASALTGELWLNAALLGMGTTLTAAPSSGSSGSPASAASSPSGLPETRAEALSALSRYRGFAAQSRDALDALAKAAAGNPIEEQYFPRAASAEAILTLNAAVSRYLMGIAFDLKTEKRITLERPTNPMLLAIKEYGVSAANADYYFDLLCRSNGLHGRELLLLPANREVVIYA